MGNFNPRSSYQQIIKDTVPILDEDPSNLEDFKQIFEELNRIEILLSYNCLTDYILFTLMRALIQHYGIIVERRSGLRIATAVASADLENDELRNEIHYIESHEISLFFSARNH